MDRPDELPAAAGRAVGSGAPQRRGGSEIRGVAEKSKALVAGTTAPASGTAAIVFFIHMTRCGDCDKADWRSYFGSLTFELAAAP